MLDDFKFKFDPQLVELMTPGPNTPITILKNEPIDMFVFMNEKFEAVKSANIQISYFDSIEN